jgi:hypothetical protein
MGWLEAVGQIARAIANFMQAVVMVLPDLINLVHSWVEYWQAKNKRQKDAIADEVAAKLHAQDTASRKAQANLKAAMMIYDSVWKDTYAMFLQHLTSDKPENALHMVKEANFAEASTIIFDNPQPNDIKAQLLTDIIRRSTV